MTADRGSASIWVLAAGALMITVTSTVLLAGSATIARHQAQAAADLGALAGAVRAELEPGGACAAAAPVVVANAATMRSCQADGLDVIVTAIVPVEGAPAGIGPAVAVARAGPIQTPVAEAPPVRRGHPPTRSEPAGGRLDRVDIESMYAAGASCGGLEVRPTRAAVGSSCDGLEVRLHELGRARAAVGASCGGTNCDRYETRRSRAATGTTRGRNELRRARAAVGAATIEAQQCAARTWRQRRPGESGHRT